MGAAWAAEVRAVFPAVEVLAYERPLDEVLGDVNAHWTLNPRP
ncbi:hypothetical protein ACWEPC_07345 [Nonomuraea sp. NPDC004297]